MRGILAKTVTEAARYIAEHHFVKEGSPILVRFIALVASRFGVVVSEKVAAQAVPVIGALGGAVINYVFVEHFQDVARVILPSVGSSEFTGRTMSAENMSDSLRARDDRNHASDLVATVPLGNSYSGMSRLIPHILMISTVTGRPNTRSTASTLPSNRIRAPGRY